MAEWLIGTYVLVMATFTGLELIKKVPTTLHTPLMSGANAISGITIVGAILALADQSAMSIKLIASLGLILATINVFGGYAVTNRMLKMFKKNPRGQR